MSSRGRGPALALACALLVAAAGCPGGRGPSRDYANARSKHDALAAELGDDAYLSPAMAEVEKLLALVPERSSDAAAATELQGRITVERARVQRERAEQAAAPQDTTAADPWASEPRPEEPPPEEPDAGVADAGTPYPITGMTVAEVRARFSYCFLPAQSVTVGGTSHDAFELRNLPSCRDGFPQFQGQLLLAREGRVVGTLPASDIRSVTVMLDGGLPR